ncbi:MAG TPA: hypothetical protein VJK72_04405, partial [Candidatus Nanoarchaeia archaeon]|nr:hypothetical protein [Candidatus Nanoarchaeia archaeon]
AKSKVHFHAVPERYTQAGIDDVLRADIKNVMTSLDSYVTNSVEPALNAAQELYRLQPKPDPADGLVTTVFDYYWGLLGYARTVLNRVEKTSQDMVTANFRNDEILEKKLAGAASVKAVAQGLQERDYIYFITKKGRIGYGLFTGLSGWFFKELCYEPDHLPSYHHRDGFERNVPLKNIFFLERVSTRAPAQKL